MRFARWLLGMFTLAALAGCDDGEATQLIVVVDTDFPIPSGLDSVNFDIVGSGGMNVTTDASLVGAALPLTLALEPANDPGAVEIRVTGRLAGADVVEQIVETAFISKQRRLVHVFLSAACQDVDCSAGETCRQGVCTARFVEPTTLPRFEGEPGRVDGGIAPGDAGGMDGGMDGGTDGGMDDAGADAGSDAGDASTDAGLDAPIDADTCGCAIGVSCIDGVCEDQLAVDVFMGQRFTCIRRASGVISCLGDNTRGQLGNGAMGGVPQLTPTDVIGFGGGAAEEVKVLSLGFDFACAVTERGEVFCWGANEAGELGDGTIMSRPIPQRVPGLAAIEDVSCGSNHTCAVALDGSVSCFGGNADGQLGDGTTMIRTSPVSVADDPDATHIASGFNFTCAILRTGIVNCWGSGVSGENGNSMFMDINRPGLVTGIPAGVSAIAITTGSDNSCIILEGGNVRCWGAADFGRLGDNGASGGSDQFMAVPLPALAEITQIGNGPTASHACVLAPDGEVLCWGGNRFGQIGDGSVGVEAVVPTGITLPAPAIAVDTGGVHTCAVLTTGRVYCWGENTRGQLGDTTMDDRSVPTEATAFFE